MHAFIVSGLAFMDSHLFAIVRLPRFQ